MHDAFNIMKSSELGYVSTETFNGEKDDGAFKVHVMLCYPDRFLPYVEPEIRENRAIYSHKDYSQNPRVRPSL